MSLCELHDNVISRHCTCITSSLSSTNQIENAFHRPRSRTPFAKSKKKIGVTFMMSSRPLLGLPAPAAFFFRRAVLPYLCGFRLAGTSRAGWSTTKLEMEGTGEGQVATVSQGRDDETSTVSKVLVAVGKLSIHCTHIQIILNPVVPDKTITINYSLFQQKQFALTHLYTFY